MIPIYFSVFLSPLIIVFHLLMIWVLNINKNLVRLMFVSFFIYSLIWLLLTLYYCDYTSISYKEYLASVSLIIFFSLGYMEFFSMVCRGFSLRIMTDIYLNKSITKESLINAYADGKGIKWMLEKRLNSIHQLGLINFDGKNLLLVYPRGYIFAYLTILLQKILNIKKGGE